MVFGSAENFIFYVFLNICCYCYLSVSVEFSFIVSFQGNVEMNLKCKT